MALSDSEKTKIVTDLGYPTLTIKPGSIHYANWINDRLVDITAEGERCVRDLLNRLLDIDKKLEKALCRVGIQRIDGITFQGAGEELRYIRKERRRILCELSDALDIPLYACSGGQGSVTL